LIFVCVLITFAGKYGGVPSDMHCKVAQYAENHDTTITAVVRNAIENHK
jgi:hypothetical protein